MSAWGKRLRIKLFACNETPYDENHAALLGWQNLGIFFGIWVLQRDFVMVASQSCLVWLYFRCLCFVLYREDGWNSEMSLLGLWMFFNCFCWRIMELTALIWDNNLNQWYFSCSNFFLRNTFIQLIISWKWLKTMLKKINAAAFQINADLLSFLFIKESWKS